jgi:hypothetical protein
MTAFDRVTPTWKFGSHKVCWPVYVALIQDSVFIGFDVLASLDTFIFAGQEDSRIGKGDNPGILSCYGKDPICSAVLIIESCWLPLGSKKDNLGHVQNSKKEP